MKPARVMLLVVALVAGGLAAFLATRNSPSEAQVITQTEVQQEQKTQILIATRTIGVGERLGPESVQWQDWPVGAVRAEYITLERLPDAPQQMTGTVARFEIFAGEPVREAKLVRSAQGYLSAVLSQGMRAVSIGVTAESGAGGFIVPNDRVDVVLTGSGGAAEVSRTILANVKVLAIGQRLGEVGAGSGATEGETVQPQTFDAATIATLELDPSQAETIINAASVGELSLVLRSVVDFAKKTEPLARRESSQAIRVIRYGKESSIMSGAAQSDDPAEAIAVQNAAFPDGQPSAPGATPPIFTVTPVQSAPPPSQPQ